MNVRTEKNFKKNRKEKIEKRKSYEKGVLKKVHRRGRI